MAFSRLVFTVLFLSVSCYASSSIRVPVFLWGDLAETSSKANPLASTTAEQFSKILGQELASDPYTVVFSDATLSVEDLSRKNVYGETYFPYLHANLGKSLYLPSVESPLRVLEQVGHKQLTENGLTETESEDQRFLFVNLNDAKEGESRADLLRRHNDFMEETFTQLKKDHKNVIAIYTAQFPSWVIPEETHSRVRRQAADNSTSESEDLALDGLRLYVKNIQILNGNNTRTLDGIPVAQTNFNETVMNTTLTFGDDSLVLNFILKGGYWYFDSVLLNVGTTSVDLYPSTVIYALVDFSYRCAENVRFSSTNITQSINFQDLQIQPYFTHTNESTKFGYTFDCVGFFSAPIWAGLMVTFLLLAITFYGIMMMMDIRTMDRFDDPKGKTITINTSE